MKVKLNVPVPALNADAGDVVDISPPEAEAWVERGNAEYVVEEKPKRPKRKKTVDEEENAEATQETEVAVDPFADVEVR